MQKIFLKSWRRATLTGLVLALASLTFSVNQPSVQATNSYPQTEDTTPPQLEGLTFSRTSVNTTNDQQFVLLTGRITDDLSGVPFGVSIELRSPSGQQHITGGLQRVDGGLPAATLDAAYQGVIGVPQFTESGIYRLETINVVDQIGNTRTYTQAQLTALGFPTAIEVISTPDVTVPQLMDFNLSPSSVDATLTTQFVILSGRITDDLSGVPFGLSINFTSSTGQSLGGSLQRVNGGLPAATLDTQYQGIVVVPQHTQLGIYRLEAINVIDLARNVRTYSPAELAALGFPITIEVTNIPDVTPPQLVELNFTPPFVNTSRGGQFVNLSGRVTDDLSGVPFNISLAFTNSSGRVINGGLTPVSTGSGTTNLDKLYQGTLFVSTEPGIYELKSVQLTDRIGNVRTYTQAQLTALGFPTKLYVDTQPPAANSIITGRVLDSNGRGVYKATVILTHPSGEQRSVKTNPFGYYSFNEVTVGNTYNVEARHKRFIYTARNLTITGESHNLNFTVK